MPSFNPIKNRVLVKPYADKASKILETPEEYEGAKTKGIVVEIGPKITSVKPGDAIIFERIEAFPVNGCGRVKLDDEDYYVMPEENILAIVE